MKMSELQYVIDFEYTIWDGEEWTAAAPQQTSVAEQKAKTKPSIYLIFAFSSFGTKIH